MCTDWRKLVGASLACMLALSKPSVSLCEHWHWVGTNDVVRVSLTISGAFVEFSGTSLDLSQLNMGKGFLKRIQTGCYMYMKLLKRSVCRCTCSIQSSANHVQRRVRYWTSCTHIALQLFYKAVCYFKLLCS